MENQTLPIPALSAEQVKLIIDYANDTLPTRYGNLILAFIEKVAIEQANSLAPQVEQSPSTPIVEHFQETGELLYKTDEGEGAE